MAGLSKVINFKPTAAGTIGGAADARAVKGKPLARWVEDILDQLPPKIIETPYRGLPSFLSTAILGNRSYRTELFDRVEVGRVKPKAAHLLTLLTTTQELRRKLREVPQAHRKAIFERMKNAGIQRSRDLTIVAGRPYEVAAMAIAKIAHQIDLNVLFELLELGLISLCKEPAPLSKKQAEILLRKEAVLSIQVAFRRADKSLDREGLVTVARALARWFPAEAGLASIKSSTVRDILRTRNHA